MKELLRLIKGMKMNRVAVAVSFIVRLIQPCKERAHLGFEFKGETDSTWERPEILSRNVVEERACRCFEQTPASKFIFMRVRPGWCAKGHKVYTGSG